MAVRHDLDLLRHIVKNQQRVCEQEGQLRETQFVFAARGNIFERADHVVPEISDRPPDEAREVRNSDRAVGRHQVSNPLQRICA